MPWAATAYPPAFCRSSPVPRPTTQYSQMEEHAKQHYESRQQAAIRHRVDAEAQRMMQGARSAALFEIHSQGCGHPVLQGEVPLDLQLKTEMEQAPGSRATSKGSRCLAWPRISCPGPLASRP